jgi:hypothetical protein
MKSSLVYKIILCILGVAACRYWRSDSSLAWSIDLYASNQITISNNISALSEIGAPAGVLIALAITIISGAFFSKRKNTSFVVSALVYLSYGIWRITSIGIDGMSGDSLVYAAVLEIVVGLVCVLFLFKYKLGSKSS